MFEFFGEVNQNEIDNYITVINTISKKFIKNKDGKYEFDNKIYDKIIGLREEVWNYKAYKTSGGLIKNDLIMNSLGKIVSKKKCIQESANNRFEKYGINKKHDDVI